MTANIPQNRVASGIAQYYTVDIVKVSAGLQNATAQRGYLTGGSKSIQVRYRRQAPYTQVSMSSPIAGVHRIVAGKTHGAS